MAQVEEYMKVVSISYLEGKGYTWRGGGYPRDMAQVEEYMKVVSISYLEGKGYTWRGGGYPRDMAQVEEYMNVVSMSYMVRGGVYMEGKGMHGGEGVYMEERGYSWRGGGYPRDMAQVEEYMKVVSMSYMVRGGVYMEVKGMHGGEGVYMEERGYSWRGGGYPRDMAQVEEYMKVVSMSYMVRGGVYMEGKGMHGGEGVYMEERGYTWRGGGYPRDLAQVEEYMKVVSMSCMVRGGVYMEGKGMHGGEGVYMEERGYTWRGGGYPRGMAQVEEYMKVMSMSYMEGRGIHGVMRSWLFLKKMLQNKQ